jgi:protein-arginine kinase activator protein McsA
MKIHSARINPFYYCFDATSCDRCGVREGRQPIYSHAVENGMRGVYVCEHCGQAYTVYYSADNAEAFRQDFEELRDYYRTMKEKNAR